MDEPGGGLSRKPPLSLNFESKNTRSSSGGGGGGGLELDFSGQANVGDRRSKLRLSFGKSETAERPAEASMKTSISLPLQMQSLEDIGFRPQIDRLQSRSMQTTGKLQLSPDVVYEFTADDLTDLGEIGRGNYGSVNKMMHQKSGTIMAVKRILSNVDEREQKELIELAVVMRSTNCVNIIQFFGAIFKDGDCWICMELMDSSLDKFYKFVYGVMKSEIPEEILGKIAVATLNALSYLKSSLNIIHRDVKPSNILLDRKGNIKLCDFGISGRLIDSIARTNVGCRPYMAPERIDPTKAQQYDIRADVWSLGITLMELALGEFPYPIQEWDNVFKQLSQVVEGEAPRLHRDKHPRFSDEFISLLKEVPKRPKYKDLMIHQFIKNAQEAPTDTRAYVESVLAKMDEMGIPGIP
ncbi:Dual specificity mitogen-activated protein kinase kinase 4 [Hypsibius exemplaris]|uniref:mitogen-activated protein kinase kinase n=1 Tax=Hypsibius exemplaris TaxID=2072580 RepID=A0A1W0XAH9_HYPEX|nr:Dual specificity mitogen-activated protein kinase kinase 4 [Hypsibius exemplaris]